MPVDLTARRRFLELAVASPLLALARPASAHHGWGSYDAASPVDVAGRVASMTYDNPHAAMMLAGPDREWEVVLAPPSRMRNRGVMPEMIGTGATVRAFGYPSRVHATEMRAEWIEIAGTTYQLR